MKGMDPRTLPLVRHILALEDAGWHVVELRPSTTDELALWRVTIERYDEHATVTLTEADPEAALAELLRYAQVDGRETSTDRTVPKIALVDLLAHASSAARIAGHLDDRDGSTALEQLSGHIDALAHGLSELLGDHRLTAELQPTAEETNTVDALRHLMARADVLASTTDEQCRRTVVLTEGDDCRDFKRLAHLVEMTALAVTAASEASAKLIATIARDSPQERA